MKGFILFDLKIDKVLRSEQNEKIEIQVQYEFMYRINQIWCFKKDAITATDANHLEMEIIAKPSPINLSQMRNKESGIKFVQSWHRNMMSYLRN